MKSAAATILFFVLYDEYFVHIPSFMNHYNFIRTCVYM